MISVWMSHVQMMLSVSLHRVELRTSAAFAIMVSLALDATVYPSPAPRMCVVMEAYVWKTMRESTVIALSISFVHFARNLFVHVPLIHVQTSSSALTTLMARSPVFVLRGIMVKCVICN